MRRKIGIYRPRELPESFNICIDNLSKYFRINGFDCFFSDKFSELLESDLIWDPRAGGGNAPPSELVVNDVPIVVTLHGVGPLVFPRHYSFGFRHLLRMYRSNRKKKDTWRKLGVGCQRIVTVSEFSKLVINETLKLPLDKIEVVYNGVDTDIFTRNQVREDKPKGAPYFLHISNDESRKNIDRIIAAYRTIDTKGKWPLIIKVSSDRASVVKGVRIINRRLDNSELALLYSDAGAFVFPSIYEGFGIPIIEAMASGCPVITSSGTACEEVAGKQASLVDPHSVKDIASKMKELMINPPGEKALDSAFEYSQQFSWKTASEQYCSIFNEVLGNG